MSARWFQLTSAAFVAVLPVGGLAFELGPPVACTVGQDCQIQHLIDRDPGPGTMDFACGSLTYDGHQGVDIAVPSVAAMEAGVKVLAAAPGRVRAVRDGMPDRIPEQGPKTTEIAGKECGNGLVIDHAEGWSTQYCHMKRNSLTVRVGDIVASGSPLGQIGLSGLTEFPHLHFMLRKGDQIVDPFDGAPLNNPCSVTLATDGGLWSPDAKMQPSPGGFLSFGFLDRMPDYAEILAAAPRLDRVPKSAPALVFWANAYGLQQGDVLRLSILAANGAVLAEDRFLMDRARARQFRAVGRRLPEGGWPAELYSGRAELLRGGAVVRATDAVLEILDN